MSEEDCTGKIVPKIDPWLGRVPLRSYFWQDHLVVCQEGYSCSILLQVVWTVVQTAVSTAVATAVAIAYD